MLRAVCVQRYTNDFGGLGRLAWCNICDMSHWYEVTEAESFEDERVKVVTGTQMEFQEAT